jgi:hypothetical protein
MFINPATSINRDSRILGDFSHSSQATWESTGAEPHGPGESGTSAERAGDMESQQ